MDDRAPSAEPQPEPQPELPPQPPPLQRGLIRSLLRLVVIGIVALALHAAFQRAEAWISASRFDWAMPGLVLVALLVYALLIAIPFVPGVEIGLGLLAMSGPDVAPLVWLATALGLTLAFVAGSTVPLRWFHRVVLDLRLVGLAQLLERFEALPPHRRVAFLHGLLPKRYCGWIVRYRYLNLAVLINIPGNSVIGGGGGIAMISGLSGVFRLPLAALTIALATAPVPLAIWMFDLRIPWG